MGREYAQSARSDSPGRSRESGSRSADHLPQQIRLTRTDLLGEPDSRVHTALTAIALRPFDLELSCSKGSRGGRLTSRRHAYDQWKLVHHTRGRNRGAGCPAPFVSRLNHRTLISRRRAEPIGWTPRSVRHYCGLRELKVSSGNVRSLRQRPSVQKLAGQAGGRPGSAISAGGTPYERSCVVSPFPEGVETTALFTAYARLH